MYFIYFILIYEIVKKISKEIRYYIVYNKLLLNLKGRTFATFRNME